MIDLEHAGELAQDSQESKLEVSEKKINLGVLFLGLLCIVFGVVYFYTSAHWSGITLRVSYAQVWPLGMIALGLSLFAARTTKTLFIGIFITILAVITTASTVLFQDSNVGRKDQRHTVEFQEGVNRGTVVLDYNAGKLIVQGGINTRFLESFYESNYTTWSPQAHSESSNHVVTLSQPEFWSGLGNYYKNLTTRISTITPVSLQISGTGLDATLDLSDIKIENLTLSLKASDATITMGSTVDESALILDVMASAITIIYPREVGVEIIPLATLSRENFPGFIPSGDGVIYRSEGYDQSVKRSRIALTHTVSRITVIQQ